MVSRKFLPWLEYTQLVRRIRYCPHCRDGLFARQFTRAVDAQRVGHIVFGVGRRLAAVEHVVGGVVDQRDAQGLGFFGQDTGRRGIDREGHIGLVLGLVDSGMRRRVDDQPGTMAADLLADLFGVGQVELVATEHHQFAQALQPLLQFAGNLAVLAGDEDFQGCAHGNRSASSRGLPC